MTGNEVRIDGALALVTGAGRGIGRATALALARRGARVIAVDIDGPGATATAADCGGWAQRVDVGRAEEVVALADRVVSDHGVPDILVNNAGVGMTGHFLDMSLDDWSWIVGINLTGVVHLCRVFGPGMVQRRSGQVVNVSSGLAYLPHATESAYVTTKAAVLAFSQCLRADWHDRGVGVSVVCPGVINTDIVRHNTRFRGVAADTDARRRAERLFARGHRPEKVATAIVDAVARNRSVVPVGVESRIAWWLRGLVPTSLVDLSARAGTGAA